tara:strand:- start:1061 stop:1612 length:552 start_codon:yes stop_codon:yes gene_type:complete
MKITKRQLRKLIREAVYKFGKPPRTVDYEIKRFNQERERSNARIDSKLSPRARGNLADFDEDDPDYAEELRLGLDPDRPEIIRLRQTFETVSVFRHPENIEIEIPQALVNDVIEAHKQTAPTGIIFTGNAVFLQAGLNVFHYIEDEVKRIAGSDKNVYEYGLAVRGYRADEYQAAMNAVGEYL